MLAIQQTKIVNSRRWGSIPPYKKGVSKRFGGGLKMTGGLVERVGVKGTDDGCRSVSVPLSVSVHVHVFANVSRRRTRTRRRIGTRTRLRTRIRTVYANLHTYPYVIRTFHPRSFY